MNDKSLDYASIINRVLKYQEALTDWEVEFISSIYSRVVDKNISLTPKQEEKLLSIHRRVIKNSVEGATGKRSWR